MKIIGGAGVWETLFRPAVGKLLTVLGFVGGAGVALAAQMATPSWFDPARRARSASAETSSAT